jgi:hypothetical protein
MIKNKMARIILAFVFASLLAATPAFGWGEEGHRIVADIAEKYLNPKAAAAAKVMLPGWSLADVANYADHYRTEHTNTAPWHFVDIPLAATSYNPQRDCTAHHGCVIEQIEVFKKQLADTNTPAADRVFALKFLIHLVGDLHQPLHCEDNEDHGGNFVKVSLFGDKTDARANLHSAWDSGLIKHTGLTDQQYAAALTANLQSTAITTLQAGTTIGWAMQSHEFARLAYQIHGDHDLGEAYFKRMKPALDTSLLRGGVRLARVLNETLGK